VPFAAFFNLLLDAMLCRLVNKASVANYYMLKQRKDKQDTQLINKCLCNTIITGVLWLEAILSSACLLLAGAVIK
jgi:hypothetical protein